MAETSSRILIIHALEELSRDELTKFSGQMRERRGDGVKPDRFRLAQVEGKTLLQLADLLVGSFAAHAVPVTVALLRAIDCNNVANNLEEDAKDLPAPKSQSCGEQSGATAVRAKFVDKHRKALIDRVSNVASILDHLLDKKVLNNEQYDKAMAYNTKQDQMRFLFTDPLRAGGDRSKDVLLSALEEQESFLIKELRESNA